MRITSTANRIGTQLRSARCRSVVFFLTVAMGSSSCAFARAAEDDASRKLLSDAPEGTFTIAVIPDTQRYFGPGSGRGDESGEPRNPAFDSRTHWLAENLDKQRIVFVSHVGDIVDRNNHHQWRVARALMDRFHDRVPYGICVGNHDLSGRTGDSSLFQEYFGAERFRDMPWYGGTYTGLPELGPQVSGNNTNSFQLFTAGGMEFVIVHVECNAPDDVLAWVDAVLQEHCNRMAIVTTHMYLGPVPRPASGSEWLTVPQGRMQWKKVHGDRGNTPQQMWEKCFSRHANLFLVLAGDQSAVIALRHESHGEHDNVVYEVMQDYPRNSDDSDWLRLYRFHPQQKEIRVFTYSPAQDRLCDGMRHVDHWDDHQFVLDISDAMTRHLRASPADGARVAARVAPRAAGSLIIRRALSPSARCNQVHARQFDYGRAVSRRSFCRKRASSFRKGCPAFANARRTSHNYGRMRRESVVFVRRPFRF